MDELTVYTLDEVAQIVKTTTQTILDEIKTGGINAFRVGADWRITREELINFIAKGGSQPGNVDKSSVQHLDLAIKKVEPFKHTWPGGETEQYPQAFEGLVKNKTGSYEIKIGIGDRFAAGQQRKRVVVFINGRPTVEFAGTDDFKSSQMVASLITLPNRKRLKPRQDVPNEYKSFSIERYNSILTGPRAMSTMAVVAKIDDYNTMVAHALIRMGYRTDT